MIKARVKKAKTRKAWGMRYLQARIGMLEVQLADLQIVIDAHERRLQEVYAHVERRYQEREARAIRLGRES